MASLPDHLRLEAEEYAESLPADYGTPREFLDGVEWLYSRLMGVASEFDEKDSSYAADKAKSWDYLISNKSDFKEGARWQHQQDQVIIAALKIDAAESKQSWSICNGFMYAAEKERDEARAEIKALKLKIEEMGK